MVVKGDEDDRHRKEQDIPHHVDVGGANHLGLHGVTVDGDPLDAAGVDQVPDLVEGTAEQNHETGDLQTASRRTRAGADEHDQHQKSTGQLGPGIEVFGGEARSGNQGGHREGNVAQSLPQGIEQPADVEGDNQDHGADDADKAAKLAVEGLLEPSEKEQVVAGEIHREQQHKGDHHPLDIGRIARHAVVEHPEATRTRRTEGGTQSLKNTQSPAEQEDELDQRESQIDGIQDQSGGLDPGHQLGDRGAGALGLHDVHILPARQGDEGHDEDQHAHAAHPVGEAAPHEHTAGQRLHGGENGGTRGGKARNRLEDGVHVVRDRTRDEEGNSPEQRQDDPGQGDDDEALAGIEHGILGLFPDAKPADGGADQGGDGKVPDLGLGVAQARNQGYQHESRLKDQEPSQNVADHFIVHRLPLTEGYRRCRRWPWRGSPPPRGRPPR